VRRRHPIAAESKPIDRDERACGRRSPIIFIMAAAVILVALFAVLSLQVCRDWAFVCENTGSQKGYRQWFTGRRTGQWYQESHLEQFMDQAHPGVMQHQWVSYAGTGRNIFGQAILFGHGRPKHTSMLHRAAFDCYVDSLDDVGKLDFYHTLASGQQGEIAVHMEEMQEAILARAKLGLPPE